MRTFDLTVWMVHIAVLGVGPKTHGPCEHCDMDAEAWRTAFRTFQEAPGPWDFLLEWARTSRCLPVYCDWTHAFGVDERGDVFAFQHEPWPGHVGPREGKLTDLRLLNVVIRQGRKKHVWLGALLPSRPVDAQDCSMCGGTGATAIPNTICYCGGGGWVPAEDTWVNKERLPVQTTFTKLTDGWNAEPNAPDPYVDVKGTDVVLEFVLNAYQFKQFCEGQLGQLRFLGCRRYRLGPPNDEGWHRGQCRFSRIAPAWGELYEVTGDLRLDECPDDWKYVADAADLQPLRHFLFYFRDETFECDAAGYVLDLSLSASGYPHKY